MNTANLAFHSLQQVAKSVERFPLAADFFDWCRANTGFRDLQFSLSACKVEVEAAHSMSVLKERLAAGIKQEVKRPTAHFTFDANRLLLLRRIEAEVERFEREVA